MQKRKLVAIIGPTASGKTAWGEFLALQNNGEIVSADSKQIYLGMNIGTSKEKLKVEQHLIDYVMPGERVTVQEYQDIAYFSIEKILDQGKQPFLVGGSMLYAESVMNGYVFEKGKKSDKQESRYDVLKIGVAWDRDALKQRAEQRTLGWLQQGLLQEIQTLLGKGVSPEWLKSCGMEYKYFTMYLMGEISYEEALTKSRHAINQYIKRQYTWWRRHDDIHWLQDREAAAALVTKFLNGEKVV